MKKPILWPPDIFESSSSLNSSFPSIVVLSFIRLIFAANSHSPRQEYSINTGNLRSIGFEDDRYECNQKYMDRYRSGN